MKIETKLEPGDEIFFVHDNAVTKSKVHTVVTSTTKSGLNIVNHKIQYEVLLSVGYQVKDNECSGTLEGLMDILKTNVKLNV